MNLPEAFVERMKEMLGEEYRAFADSYNKTRLRGLRVNTMKISPEEFERIAPFPVKRVPWVRNGFFYDNDVFPAQHPYYAAGVYYLQEPSAMTPADRLPVEKGDRVLDLCAAPGGKATELAAKLDGTGMLVANDASNSRARALLRNLELFGTKNVMVTAELPAKLREVFPLYFDKILVDAPCSGEGMFRKAQEVIGTWSPERVEYFASQQRNILENAYEMLVPGGLLMYSTCTFSPDEDEQMISWFLEKYPDMELLDIPAYEGFSPGRPEWADGREDLRKCIRIWPHVMDGEGHFLALLHKRGENASAGSSSDRTATDGRMEQAESCLALREEGDGIRNRNAAPEERFPAFDDGECFVKSKKLKKKDRKRNGKMPKGMGCGGRAREAAAGNNALTQEQTARMKEFLAGSGIPSDRVEKYGEKGYLHQDLPRGAQHLNFLRNGILVGEWKKNRFEPSQQLAMASRPLEAGKTLTLRPEDERVEQYLRGESFRLHEGETAAVGWNLICVDDFPLGWAKIAQGQVKNKYLNSWRRS
jgi:NOL1/NOP2/sun family putative RNA methylase